MCFNRRFINKILTRAFECPKRLTSLGRQGEGLVAYTQPDCNLQIQIRPSTNNLSFAGCKNANTENWFPIRATAKNVNKSYHFCSDRIGNIWKENRRERQHSSGRGNRRRTEIPASSAKVLKGNSFLFAEAVTDLSDFTLWLLQQRNNENHSDGQLINYRAAFIARFTILVRLPDRAIPQDSL